MMTPATATAQPSGPPPPARTPEPALGVAAHLDDEDPAPWAGLGPQIPQTPALRDRPDPAPAPPAPATAGVAAARARRARRPARQAVAPLAG